MQSMPCLVWVRLKVMILEIDNWEQQHLWLTPFAFLFQLDHTHHFLSDTQRLLQAECVVKVKVNIPFNLKHDGKHLRTAVIWCALKCYQCLKTQIFLNDLWEAKIDEYRFFEVWAEYCVLWFNVNMHDLEGMHDYNLLREMCCIWTWESKHFSSLLSGILHAVIKYKDVKT